MLRNQNVGATNCSREIIKKYQRVNMSRCQATHQVTPVTVRIETRRLHAVALGETSHLVRIQQVLHAAAPAFWHIESEAQFLD